VKETCLEKEDGDSEPISLGSELNKVESLLAQLNEAVQGRCVAGLSTYSSFKKEALTRRDMYGNLVGRDAVAQLVAKEMAEVDAANFKLSVRLIEVREDLNRMEEEEDSESEVDLSQSSRMAEERDEFK
jgi:LPS O-antigen subunit length determinant protein (WzzB/FepE family)